MAARPPIKKIKLPVLHDGITCNVWLATEKYLACLPEWKQKRNKYSFSFEKRYLDKKTGDIKNVRGFMVQDLPILLILIVFAMIWVFRKYEGDEDMDRFSLRDNVLSDDTLDDDTF